MISENREESGYVLYPRRNGLVGKSIESRPASTLSNVDVCFGSSGCGALFAGQEALHAEILSTLDYMLNQVATAMNYTVNSAPPAATPAAGQTAAAIIHAANSTSEMMHRILDQV